MNADQVQPGPVRRGLFLAFATFSVLALIVTSVWAWRSVSQPEASLHADAEASHVVAQGEPQPASFASEGRLGAVGAFSFTERSERSITEKDLLGKVWIANFIFTNCPGVCPRLSGAMAKLQRELKKTGVMLVSFTVDPERDTPARLREYAGHYEADKERWLFLTGGKEALHEFIQESFKLAVGDAGDKKNPLAMDITHSGRFVLLDRESKIVGFFDAEDPAALEQLRAKAAALDR